MPKANSNAIENVNVIGNVANVTQNRTPTQRANVSSSICLNFVYNLSVLPSLPTPDPSLSVCLSVWRCWVINFRWQNFVFLIWIDAFYSPSLYRSLSLSSTLAVPVRQVCQQRRYCRKSAVWPVDGGLSTQLTDNTWFRGVFGFCSCFCFGFLLLFQSLSFAIWVCHSCAKYPHTHTHTNTWMRHCPK